MKARAMAQIGALVVAILGMGIATVGCNGSSKKPRGNQVGGASDSTNQPAPQPAPQPSNGVTISITPSSKVTVNQGNTINFDVEVRVNGSLVSDPEGQGLVTYQLLTTNVGTIDNKGVFTASLSNTGSSGIRVAFSQNGTNSSQDFADMVEVVNQPSTPSPPKTIRLEPTTKQVEQGASFTYRVFVDLEDGTTVEPQSGNLVTALSNQGIGTLNGLLFTAFNTLLGKSDITVDVTLAGVTISQTFSDAVEVIAAGTGGGGNTNFHTFNLADIAHVTTEVNDATGAGQNRDGLVAYGSVSNVTSDSCTVRITIFTGPYGPPSHNNVPNTSAGEFLWIHPNYKDGAEVIFNQPADYDPVQMAPVAGTNDQAWELVFTKFPTTGTFSFTLSIGTAPGVRFLLGINFDSSRSADKQNLESTFNTTMQQVQTTPAP